MSEAFIRRAEEKDIPQIARLLIQTVEYVTGIAPEGFGFPLGEHLTYEENCNYFAGLLSSPESLVLVAELGSIVVGYLVGVVENHSDDLIEAPFLTVEYLGVRPDSRRLGIARELMLEAENYCKQRDLRTVELLVWATNQAAGKLFEQIGYSKLESRMAKKV